MNCRNCSLNSNKLQTCFFFASARRKNSPLARKVKIKRRLQTIIAPSAHDTHKLFALCVKGATKTSTNVKWRRKKKRTGRSDVFQELLQLAFHAAIELYRALSGSLKDPKGLTMGHREKFDSPDFSKHQWMYSECTPVNLPVCVGGQKLTFSSLFKKGANIPTETQQFILIPEKSKSSIKTVYKSRKLKNNKIHCE